MRTFLLIESNLQTYDGYHFLPEMGGALRPVSSDVLHVPCLNYLEELLMLVQEGKLT